MLSVVFGSVTSKLENFDFEKNKKNLAKYMVDLNGQLKKI